MNNSIFKSLGNTELIEIKKLTSHLPSHIKVYAKAEYQNPSGSVKDRAAFSIIQDALNTQKLSPNKILLDATSGNTGMAYAYLGQKLGFKVQLVVQQSMSQIRQNILKNYGAELIYSDPNLGFDGAIALTQKLITEHPDQYYFPDQFNNPKNWEGHFKSTGPEIWNQTKGAVTHFVAIMGTTGTFTGNGKFLKTKKADIKLIEVQPDSNFHGIEGTRFLDATPHKGFYDASLKSERILVTTEEAMSMAKKIRSQEGHWVGISAGANLAATLKIAERLSSLPATPCLLVTIFCDSGERYADFEFWNDPSF